MTNAINPYLRKPDHPSYLRRARHHDYCRPARYLITMSKAESTPNLSLISGDFATPSQVLTPAGISLQEAIEQWPTKYPQLVVAKYVVMPDHVHICVDVREYMEAGLSRAVASLMGMATKKLQLVDPFFKKGFNDRIAYTDDKWQRQLAYVDDNPRRYLIKKAYPDLFRRRWIISIGDWQYMAIGNILLLKNPDIEVVRFSHRFAPGVFEAKEREWQRCVENNGVLVSPFIHPKENAMQKYALDEGGAVIRICENGFAERFAPQGRDFDRVAEGRLLLIGAIEHNTRSGFLTYGKAQGLNTVAERIASTDWLSGQGRLTVV